MRVPIFQSIEVQAWSKEGLREAYNRQRIEIHPSYLDLTLKDVAKTNQAIAWTAEIFQEDNRILIPFPLYIIAPKFLGPYPDDGAVILSSPSQLPKHYLKKAKKLKNRESALMKKTEIMIQRIQNHELPKDDRWLKRATPLYRQLKEATLEAHYYYKWLKDIQRAREKSHDE